MVSWSHEEWAQALDMFYSAAERLADVGDPSQKFVISAKEVRSFM